MQTGTVQHFDEDHAVLLLGEKLFVGEVLQVVAGPRFGRERHAAVFLLGLVHVGLQRPHDFFGEVVDVSVSRLVLRDENHFGCLSLREVAGSPDSHQADSRRFVGCGSLQQIERIGKPIAPIGRHFHSRRAGTEVG